MNNKTFNFAVWNKGGHWASKLTKKLNELTLLLTDHSIDVMVICEANLKGTASLTIPGYDIIKGTNENNRVVIIHKNYLEILSVETSEILPSIKLKVRTGKEELILVGAYREFKPIGEQNRSIREETEIFKSWFKELKLRKDQKIILGGDLNVDWNRRGQQTFERKELISFLEQETSKKGMIQQIAENSRVVKKSSTLIDLIFTTNVKVTNSEVVNTSSDHHLVLVKIDRTKKREVTYKEIRDWRGFSKEKLLIEARKYNWIEICWIEDIDEAVKILTEYILEIFNKLAPVRRVQELIKLEWKTPDLATKIATRNEMKRNCIKYQKEIQKTIAKLQQKLQHERLRLRPINLTTDEINKIEANNRNWETYKQTDKTIRKEIEMAKDKAITKKIRELGNDPKILHREIKKLDSESDRSIPTLTWNGKTANTDEEKCHMIHDAIEEKLNKVERKLGDPKGDAHEVILNNYDKKDTFNLREFDDHEIFNTIRQAPNKTSVGDDNISYVMLKYLKTFITKPLRSIINRSIRTAYFPTKWKLTLVAPVYKNGKIKTSPESYRPVSLLGSMSRIMELLIAKSMDRYAETEKILSDQVHGYRANRGCVSALLEVTNDVQMNDEEVNLMTLTAIDISAGFDTVSVSYLLRSLKYMGYGEKTLQWLDSYLSNRYWKVKIGLATSEWRLIRKGIPQGGPMSPSLFRDFCNAIALRIETVKNENCEGKLKTIPDKNEEAKVTRGGITFKQRIPITDSTEVTLIDKPDDNFLNNRILEKIENKTATTEDIHDLKINGQKRFKSIKKTRKMAKISMYADDNGCRQKFANKTLMLTNTSPILEKLFNEMRCARLQINSDKTSILVICSTKKRNNELKHEPGENNFKIPVEGHIIQEDQYSKLLGVWFDRNGTFEKHAITTKQAILGKLTPLWRITDKITFLQRKELAQSRLLSILYYGIEVTSQAAENVINILRMALSRIMMWVTNTTSIENWSRTNGLRCLNWNDIEITAMTKTILTARKVILTKQSKDLYEQLIEDNRVKEWDLSTIKQKTKRSWKVRASRALQILPPEILFESKKQHQVKKILKSLSEDKKDSLIKIFNGHPIEDDARTIWV